MTRLWLFLLLALSLMPSAASASWSTPVGEPESVLAEDALHGSHALRADDPHSGSHALRSSSGLELVWRSEPHGLGCPGGARHRSSDRAPDAYVVLGRSALLRPRARLLARPGTQDVDDAVAPLCESLPYFATAPPSPR